MRIFQNDEFRAMVITVGSLAAGIGLMLLVRDGLKITVDAVVLGSLIAPALLYLVASGRVKHISIFGSSAELRTGMDEIK